MRETQSFEGEQGGTISRHLALGTMGNLHQAQRNQRIFVWLITLSTNDLSSRLLKIEQISTIASFSLKLVQNSFLYRLYQLQILNSGCGL